MALSKRLFALYQMVEKGSVVADIGCDHGLLPIALLQDNICDHAYACDLRKGPLERARRAIRQCGLQDKITTLLRNGMDDLPRNVDTIVIAGMGFDTIKMILEAHLDELPTYQSFIVQSNKHVEDLRRWISDHHFTILQETIVEEDHFYQILKFSCDFHDVYDEDEILFGCTLSKHVLFSSYWKLRLTKIELALENMPKEKEAYHELTSLKKRILEKVSSLDTNIN